MKREDSLEKKENSLILYQILGLSPTCTQSEVVTFTRKKATEKWP